MEENKGVADEFVVPRTGGSFIGAEEFDGDGLVLEVVGMEKITPNNPKFGVKNEYGAGGVVTKENWFIEKGLLDEGQTFSYKFKVGDEERSFEKSSLGFYFAFTKVNPKAGEKVSIKRNKLSDTKVEWDIAKVE